MVYQNRPAISRPVVITAQWTGLPEDVVDDVREMWRTFGYGNDFYYVPFDVNEAGDMVGGPYPALVAYMREHELEEALIHFWW